jgi:hypothetical protein
VRWINVPNVRIGIFNKEKKRGKQLEEQKNRRTHPECCSRWKCQIWHSNTGPHKQMTSREHPVVEMLGRMQCIPGVGE